MDDLIQWPRAVYWDKPFNMWSFYDDGSGHKGEVVEMEVEV